MHSGFPDLHKIGVAKPRHQVVFAKDSRSRQAPQGRRGEDLESDDLCGAFAILYLVDTSHASGTQETDDTVPMVYVFASLKSSWH